MASQNPFDWGEQLKLEGMDQALEHAPENWLAEAWACLYMLAASGYPFTSEDLIARVGLPAGHVAAFKNSAMGGLMSGAARAKIIRPVGRVKATRAVSHAIWLTLWIGTDHAEQK